MTTQYRKFCGECRCPLVKLHDFDGTSSHHGEYIGAGDVEHYRGFAYGFPGLLAIFYDAILSPLSHGLRRRLRQRKVNKLKSETLTAFPDSVICPKCLQVTSRA